MALRKKLELDITQYRRRLDEAKREARRFSREADQSADRMQDGMTRAADESERGWSRAGQSIRNTFRTIAATIAAVFSIQTIRSFAERLINANRQIEDASTRLRAVVDDERAPRLLEAIREFTARTPFQLTEVTNAFSLLVGSGLDAERMIQTVADTAAASGRSIEDTARAVGDAMEGQISRLRDLGIGIRRIGDDAVRVMDRQGEERLFSFDPSDQRSFRKAIEDALEASFDGAAERLSQTVSGRLSTLSDAFRDQLAQAGEGLFEAFGTNVESLTERLQAGEFQSALSRMAQVVQGIFTTLTRVASIIVTFGPSFLAAGAALASWRIGEMILGPFRAFRQEVKASTQDARRLLSDLSRFEVLMDPATPGISRTGTLQQGVSREDADLISRTTDALRAHNVTVEDAFEGTRKYRDMKASLTKQSSTFGRTLGTLGARVKAFASSLLSPQLILAAITAAITFIIQRRRQAAQALEEMLRPIKEMREEAERLVENLRRIEPSALVGRLRSIEIDLEINQEELVEAEARLEDVREGQRQLNITSGGLSEAEQQARRQSLQREEAELTAEIEEREKAITAQKEAQARAQTAISKSVLAQIEAKDQEIQREKETLELSEGQQKAVDNLNRTRLSALDREDTARAAVIQAEIDRILDRAAIEREAVEERIAALEAEKEILEERARTLGLLDEDAPDSPSDGDEEQQQVAITQQFRRQLELLERQRGLRGRALEEAGKAADAQEAIWRFERRRAELKEAIASGTADSTEDAEAEVRALEGLIAGEEERMALAERRSELLDSLSTSELRLVDELGGLDSALSAMDFEQLLDFAPVMQELEQLLAQMEDDIAKATAQGVKDGLSDEQIEKELDKIAESYAESLKEVLQSVDLSALPPELRAIILRFIDEMRDGADETTASFEKLLKTLGLVAQNLRSLATVAGALGGISELAEDIARGLADAADNAIRFAEGLAEAKEENPDSGFTDFLGSAAGMTSAIGVISGVVGIVGGVLESRKQRKEAREREIEAMKRLRESIEDSSIRIASAVDDFTRAARVGGGITGDEAKEATRLLARVDRFTRTTGERPLPGDRDGDTPRDRGNRVPGSGPRQPGRTAPTEDDFREFLSDLAALDLDGIDVGQFRSLFDDLLESGKGVRFAIERVMEGGLEEALSALEEDLLGRSVAGAIEGMELMQTFFGKDLPQAFDFFLSFLLDDVEGISEEAQELLEEARTLDISTAEGRKRIEEIAEIFAGAALDRDTEFLGGLTPDEVQQIAEQLLGAEVDERGVTRSTQVARAITEFQAAIVIDLLGEQVQTLHDIRDIIDGAGKEMHSPITFGDIQIYEAQDGAKIAEELQQHINRKRLN
jgi:hypothetical protein